MSVFNDRLLLREITSPKSSAIFEVASLSSSLIIKLAAPGAATCLIRVYGGFYDNEKDAWEIRTTDLEVNVLAPEETRTNFLTITKMAQVEVISITGVDAKVTIGFVNYTL